MTSEFETAAWLLRDGVAALMPVVVTYELEDGYKPLGLWVQDEQGNDITTDIAESEYDWLVEQATKHAVEYLTDAADMMGDR